MTNYIALSMWLLALYGYLSLFLAFLLATYKNTFIKHLTFYTGIFLVWSMASICMYLRLAPGFMFWFRCKQMLICFIPAALYMLLKVRVKETIHPFEVVAIILTTIAIALPAIWDFYFQPVSLNMAPLYPYHHGLHIWLPSSLGPRWTLIIPGTALTALMVRCIFLMKNGFNLTYRTSFAFGLLAFWIGEMVSSFVSPYYPVDLIGGLINSIILLRIVVQERHIRLKLFVKPSTISILGMITFFILALFAVCLNWDEYVVYKKLVFLTAIAASVVTTIATMIYGMLSNKLYFNRRDFLVAKTTSFNKQLIANVGNLVMLRRIFLDFIEKVYGETSVLLLERTNINGHFQCVYDNIGLGIDDMFLNDVVVRYIGSTSHIFKASRLLSVGNDLKKLDAPIRDGRLLQVIPMHSHNELMGIALIGNTGTEYSDVSELDFLYAIAETTAMAIDTTVTRNRLTFDARHDALTGLYNRQSVLEDLGKHLRSCSNFNLLLCTIDEIELFNSVYTLADGDELLVIFSKVLRENANGRAITLGRISGTTFAAIVDGSLKEAESFDDSARKAFIAANEGTIRKDMTFSTGLLEIDEDNTDSANELLDKANIALILARKYGKNSRRRFEKGMEDNPEYQDTGFKVKTAEAISKALDLRDHFTFSHSNNVATYARALAKAIGANEIEQQIVYEAGLIHDIGKISIPDTILMSTGKLTSDEYSLMKSHVVRSQEVIESVPHGFMILPIAMSHHERWDGKGYPFGLKGNEIPIGGRCMAIADSFDAMISRRLYKNPMPVEKALEEIERCSGSQFDPELGPLFVDLVRKGTIVAVPFMPAAE